MEGGDLYRDGGGSSQLRVRLGNSPEGFFVGGRRRQMRRRKRRKIPVVQR